MAPKSNVDTRQIRIYEGEKAYQRRAALCVLEAGLGDSIGYIKKLIQDIEGIAPAPSNSLIGPLRRFKGSRGLLGPPPN